jgi:hypothetical protein
MKAGNYKEAKSVLTQACAANTADYECEFDLAVTLMELGELHPAVIKFEDVATNTKNPRAMMYCGHCHARAGELEEARDCYRAGMSVGKNLVKWEYAWQMAYGSLISKDYEEALAKLEDARQQAEAAKIKDYRLERDLAIALHGCKKDKEALAHLNTLSELGYTPDQQLLADVKKAADSEAPKTEAKPAPETAKTEVAVAQKPPPERTEKKDPPAVEKKDPSPPTQVAQVTPPVQPAQPAPPVKEVKKDLPPDTTTKVLPPVQPVQPVQPAAQPTKDPAPVAPPKEAKVNTPATQPSVATNTQPAKRETGDANKTVPVSTKSAKRDPRPAHLKKPLPPIPTEFDDAMTAGKRAFDDGVASSSGKTEEAKQKAAESFDVAEAMFRGAWAQKPGDEKVVSAFKELARYIGAIALVKNTMVKAKVNGLVVLDASACIAPKDVLYCAWEQVDGESLSLRPEALVPNAEKKVGFRIRSPGTYKFDLAVSDGVRGGNPVTVTVEVSE